MGAMSCTNTPFRLDYHTEHHTGGGGGIPSNVWHRNTQCLSRVTLWLNGFSVFTMVIGAVMKARLKNSTNEGSKVSMNINNIFMSYY